MRFKVGDLVKIKSLDWYNANKDEYGYINCGSREFFTKMSDLCGKIATIKEICKTNCYRLEEYDFDWTDEMIEGLVEEETKPKYEDEVELVGYSTPRYLLCPYGYQFVDENGNVINARKIVLEKKKKEYPKLFVDCCAILYPNDNFQIVSQRVKGHKGDLLFHFQKLLICRDAYWMVYGEENKLGKPWEPDWTNEHQVKYTIYTMGNDVIRHVGNYIHAILAFPTAEMRDAFKENFDPDIEICKELL